MTLRYNRVVMIAQSYTFSIVLEPDEEAGGFVVHVPALPGCHTEGDTREEAIAMVQDAITGYIESLLAHNEPIPVERVPQVQTLEHGPLMLPAQHWPFLPIC